MRHFISRDDLVDLVCECPRSTIQRAALAGRVEVLGLFERVSDADSRRAWLFLVKGTKKEWIVAALLTGQRMKFRILSKVPWKWWAGRPGYLSGGDDPMSYMMRKAIGP